MRPFLEWPIIRQLHERRLLFPAGLAVAVFAVLAQGALQRRAEPLADSPPSISPTPAPPLLPRLRPDLEKTPLSYLSDYWLQLGELARPSLVRLGREGWPAVVVAPGIAVTSTTVAQALRAEAGTGPEPSFDVDLRQPGLAVVMLHEALGGQPLELAPLEEAQPGSLVATVSLRPDGRLRITPAHIASIGSSEPNAGGEVPWDAEPRAQLELSVLPAELTAGAIVNLDGKLLAVAVAAAVGEPRLLPATFVLEALHRGPAAPCRALAVAPLAPGVRKLVGRDGVVVEAVRQGAFGAPPGVEAGDVLLEWEGIPVTDAAAFAASYDSALGRRTRVLLLRDGASVRASLLVPGPDCRPMGPAPVLLDSIGLELRWAEELEPAAWQVVGVRPDSAAASAGLLAGDRLLAVSGRPVSGADARRTLEGLGRRRRATLLEIARGERVTLRALPLPTPTPKPETAAPTQAPVGTPETPR